MMIETNQMKYRKELIETLKERNEILKDIAHFVGLIALTSGDWDMRSKEEIKDMYNQYARKVK